MFLFVRCTAIDPTDKTSLRKKKSAKSKSGLVKLNYGFVMGQIVVRFLRRVERKILRTFIRRKYLDPWKTSAQIEPLLLPFPLVTKDDAIPPHLKEDDISFCSLCDFEVSPDLVATTVKCRIFALLDTNGVGGEKVDSSVNKIHTIIGHSRFAGEKAQQAL